MYCSLASDENESDPWFLMKPYQKVLSNGNEWTKGLFVKRSGCVGCS